LKDSKKKLAELREALLALHKTLVDSERATYEETFGPIPSPGQFLQLLTTDPWFGWLHPLSELIVTMDQAMDEKEPLTDKAAQALIAQARQMLKATETGDGFSKHYYEALQRDPDVVLAHGKAVRLFAAGKKGE